MLKRAALLLVVALVFTFPTTASADSAIQCPAGTIWVGGKCNLVITPPAPTGGGSASVGGSGGGAQACSLLGREIPCVSDLGYWSQSRGCYLKPVSPQPDRASPLWEGHSDGAIYNCSPASIGRGGMGYMFWAASSPVAVDPAALAQQIRASMTFTPVQIGIVPEPKAGAIGLVGLPTWLWVQNPGATVLGPQTKSLSSGGVSVTLTAKVTSTTWTMGDGGVVTCTGAGTPYEDRFGISTSPTCGYKYKQQGTYRVTARTNWTAIWTSNTGVQGVFSFAVANDTTITMGEAQVINR